MDTNLIQLLISTKVRDIPRLIGGKIILKTFISIFCKIIILYLMKLDIFDNIFN